MHNMMNHCHEEIDHNDDGIGGCVDDVAMPPPNHGIEFARTYLSPKSNTMLPIDDLDSVCRSTRKRKCSKVQPLAKNDLSKMYGDVMNKYSMCDTDIQLTISSTIIKLEQLVLASTKNKKSIDAFHTSIHEEPIAMATKTVSDYSSAFNPRGNIIGAFTTNHRLSVFVLNQ